MREKLKNIIINPISSAQQEVKILDMAIKLHKREDKIFRKTIKMKSKYGEQINILDWELYEFQMLIEMIDRFEISTKIEVLKEAQHELMLAYRFMLIGHYNSAGKHLRSFMEHIVDFLADNPSDSRSKKIKKIVNISKYKEDELLKLDPKQVYIIYGYLSNTYTHHSDPFKELTLDTTKLGEIRDSIILVILLSSRLIFWIYGAEIEKHFYDTILHPVAYEKPIYKFYILSLLSDVYFYNILMEWGLWKKIKGKKGNQIDITLRVDKEYHENTKHNFS